MNREPEVVVIGDMRGTIFYPREDVQGGLSLSMNSHEVGAKENPLVLIHRMQAVLAALELLVVSHE